MCKEITGVEEARALTMDDIVKSKYWEDTKKRDLIWGEDEDYRYWLGSSYVSTHAGGASFGLRGVYYGGVDNCYLWDSGYGEDDIGVGVRAVVSLKSKVQN